MEWIEALINNNTTPGITALLLGLINAVSHCLLATNIAAICFISKDITNKRQIFLNGLSYTLGRTVAYTSLAILLTSILKKGADISYIQEFTEHYGEAIIGPLFLIIAVFLFFADKFNLPSFNISVNKKLEKKAQES